MTTEHILVEQASREHKSLLSEFQPQVHQDIEILRVLSAFGIVWFHASAPGRDFGYSGLVVFLILSVFLSQNTYHHTRKSFMVRVRRFLVPWIIWFVFYGSIRLLTNKTIVPLENGIVAGILSGPSSHLWYLPFIFLVLATIDWVSTKLRPSVLAWIGYAFAIVALLSWGRGTVPLNPAEYPWTQYAHAMTGVSIGIRYIDDELQSSA